MIIQSKNVWINEQFQPVQVEVSEQRIVAILPYNEKAVDKEYGEKRILPGFIDIHDHGWHGGMPIMPIMNLSKSGKLTFQKKGLQLFYQQRQQHFQKTWNIHLK